MSYRKLLNHDDKTEEELQELIAIIRNNPQCEMPKTEECYCAACSAREEIVLSQMRKIWYYCKQYSTKKVKTEELVADGVLAVQETIDKFVSGETTGSFSDYVWYPIRHDVSQSDLLRGRFTYPHNTKHFIRSIYQYKKYFFDKYGYEPSPRDIASEIMIREMTNHKNYTEVRLIKVRLDSLEKNIKMIFDLNRWPINLSDTVSEDSDTKYENLIGIEDHEQLYVEMKDQIESIFDILDDEEKLIIGHYYGIDIGIINYEKLKPIEITRLLKNQVKYSRIIDRKNEIIEKIRQNDSLWSNEQARKIGSIEKKKRRHVNRTTYLGKPRSKIWNHSEQIKHDYEVQGLSTALIAERYNTSYNTVLKILKDQGCKINKPGRKRRTDIPQEIVKQLYEDGNTLDQIATEYKCSQETIRKIVVKQEGKIRPSGSRNGKSKAWDFAEDIKQQYLAGVSTVELGKQYKCSNVTIGNVLKSIGVKLERRK